MRHAAGLASPAGEDLRLDNDWRCRSSGDLLNFVGGKSHLAPVDRDAVALKDLGRLVFVQIHPESLASAERSGR